MSLVALLFMLLFMLLPLLQFLEMEKVGKALDDIVCLHALVRIIIRC